MGFYIHKSPTEHGILHPHQKKTTPRFQIIIGSMDTDVPKVPLFGPKKLGTLTFFMVGPCERCLFLVIRKVFTLPKFNMEPKNGTLEEEIPFWTPSFFGSMLNLGRVYICCFVFLGVCEFPDKCVPRNCLYKSL